MEAIRVAASLDLQIYILEAHCFKHSQECYLQFN